VRVQPLFEAAELGVRVGVQDEVLGDLGGGGGGGGEEDVEVVEVCSEEEEVRGGSGQVKGLGETG